jgi:hypothetical protein
VRALHRCAWGSLCHHLIPVTTCTFSLSHLSNLHLHVVGRVKKISRDIEREALLTFCLSLIPQQFNPRCCWPVPFQLLAGLLSGFLGGTHAQHAPYTVTPSPRSDVLRCGCSLTHPNTTNRGAILRDSLTSTPSSLEI